MLNSLLGLTAVDLATDAAIVAVASIPSLLALTAKPRKAAGRHNCHHPRTGRKPSTVCSSFPRRSKARAGLSRFTTRFLSSFNLNCNSAASRSSSTTLNLPAARRSAPRCPSQLSPRPQLRRRAGQPTRVPAFARISPANSAARTLPFAAPSTPAWPSPPSHPAFCIPMQIGPRLRVLMHMLLPPAGASGPKRRRQLAQTYANTAQSSLVTLHLLREAEQRTMTDPLTGLYNRRSMESLLEREVALAERHQRPLSLVMIDLDYFKQVNDSHGHAAGDHLLRSFADCVRMTLRKTDLAFRYGGDEFAVALPQTPVAQAEQVVAETSARRSPPSISPPPSPDWSTSRRSASASPSATPRWNLLTLARPDRRRRPGPLRRQGRQPKLRAQSTTPPKPPEAPSAAAARRAGLVRMFRSIRASGWRGATKTLSRVARGVNSFGRRWLGLKSGA